MRSVRNRLIFLFFFTTCILPGCKKEEDAKEESFRVKAGTLPTNGHYHDLQPDVTLHPETVHCFGTRDSAAIDINADGVNDLTLSLEYADGNWICDCFYQQYDSNDIVDCFPSSYLDRHVKIRNPNLQIAADTFRYNLLVLALDSGAVIDATLQWHSSHYLRLYRIGQYIGSAQQMGYWKQGTHYAGIRFIDANDTLYGWIRLNTDSAVTALDYALE